MSDFKLNESQRKLAEEHETLIWKMINTYNLDQDEWYGILASAYCKAAYAYDPSKSTKFSTLAIKYMKTVIMNEFRNKKLDKHKLRCLDSEEVISIDMCVMDNDRQLKEVIPDDSALFEDVIHGKIDSINAISNVWNVLTDMQKKYIIAMYQLVSTKDTFSQRELGEMIGVSQQRSNEIKNQIKLKILSRC